VRVVLPCYPKEDNRRGCCVGCNDCTDYVDNFTLNGDPRPAKALLCCIPKFWVRPSRCEIKYGPLFYNFLGAALLRWILKKTCYRKLNTLKITQSGSSERRRALITTIPMTIAIELGHTIGGLVHLAGVIPSFVLGNQDSDAKLSFILQIVLIYCVHFLAACVQRLNRVGIYEALHKLKESSDGATAANEV